MTVRANLTIADGETSPVNHVFSPDGDVLSTGEVAFLNRNASVPAASEVVLASVRKSAAQPEDYSVPGKKVLPRVVQFRLKYPATYVDASSGLTLVDFVDEVTIKFMIHPRSSEQRGKNLRLMTANMLIYGGTQITYATDKGEGIW